MSGIAKKLSLNSKKKRIAALLILIIILLIFGAFVTNNRGLNSKENWTQFKSDLGNFTILLPEPNPQKTSDIQVPLGNTKEERRGIVYCDSGGAYCIEVGIYPSSFNLRGDIYSLNLFKNIILQNFEKPQLISSSSGRFLTNPYIDFVFTSEKQFYKYRIFAIEDNTYALSMTSNDLKFDTFNKFVNSFSVNSYKYNKLTWKPLISEKWNFKAIFPEDFTTEVSGPNSTSFEGITYFSKPNTRTTYAITINKYKVLWDLRSLLNITLASVKNDTSANLMLISSKDSTCSNKPCLNFLAQQNDQEGFNYYKGVAISADNNTVYFIFGIVDNETYLSNIDKIINSFELISQ